MKKRKTAIVVPTVLAFLLLFSGIGFPETGGEGSHESHHPAATQQQDPEAANAGMESPTMNGGMMGGGMMSGGMMQEMMGPGNEKGMSACGSAGSGERMAQHPARCDISRTHSC